MGSGPPVPLKTLHKALERYIMALAVSPATQQGPPDVEGKQVQAVGLAVGPNPFHKHYGCGEGARNVGHLPVVVEGGPFTNPKAVA
jgi:hypothetical protein